LITGKPDDMDDIHWIDDSPIVFYSHRSKKKRTLKKKWGEKEGKIPRKQPQVPARARNWLHRCILIQDVLMPKDLANEFTPHQK
jgi:hypothetical protein